LITQVNSCTADL